VKMIDGREDSNCTTHKNVVYDKADSRIAMMVLAMIRIGKICASRRIPDQVRNDAGSYAHKGKMGGHANFMKQKGQSMNLRWIQREGGGGGKKN
jgi:hypothetical protein